MSNPRPSVLETAATSGSSPRKDAHDVVRGTYGRSGASVFALATGDVGPTGIPGHPTTRRSLIERPVRLVRTGADTQQGCSPEPRFGNLHASHKVDSTHRSERVNRLSAIDLDYRSRSGRSGHPRSSREGRLPFDEGGELAHLKDASGAS